ncbi:MAG: hypothetical protein ACFFCX_14880 [Candidatus Sifarchaeia archaeon]
MKDDECIEKVTITVFPPMTGIGIIEADPVVKDEDACGESPAPVVTPQADSIVVKLVSSDPMEKISQLLERAQVKFGESICIRWASYENKEKVDDAKEWLNAALRGSGDSTVLDEQGFSAFIGASAPIIAINNRLSFVGMVPNENQFITRISAIIRIFEEGTDR